MERIGSHLGRNLVAYLALFVALGGTTYAAIQIPKNSVGSGKVRDDSLRGRDIREATLDCAAIPECPGGQLDLPYAGVYSGVAQVVPHNGLVSFDSTSASSGFTINKPGTTITADRDGIYYVSVKARSSSGLMGANPLSLGLVLDGVNVPGAVGRVVFPTLPVTSIELSSDFDTIVEIDAGETIQVRNLSGVSAALETSNGVPSATMQISFVSEAP